MQSFRAFWIGAVGYSIIEILVRGYTHWTMAITGGLCLLIIYRLNLRMPRIGLTARALIGAAVITSAEFLVGIFVNIIMGWNVWDYSAKPMNLLGQICPQLMICWFLLCIPVSLTIMWLHQPKDDGREMRRENIITNLFEK